MNAYSEWLEGLGAECSLSVAFIFAGDIFGIRVSWPKALWMLQLLVALPSKRPALGPQPRTLANDRARFFAKKKKKTKLIFHRNKGFVLSHLWLRLQARGCWEGEISTTVSKLLTPRQRGSRGRGAGASDRENLAWMAAFPSPRRKAGVEQPISQISWGNWLLSFWQSKQKGNAINTATLIWYTVYRGEGLIVYLSTGGYRLTLICNLHVYLFPPFPLSL